MRLYTTYLEEFWSMFCHKHRGLQQSVKFIIEVGVLKAMLCHQYKQAAESHNTHNTTYVIGSCQEITAD